MSFILYEDVGNVVSEQNQCLNVETRKQKYDLLQHPYFLSLPALESIQNIQWSRKYGANELSGMLGSLFKAVQRE